jgi:hypothetical protein
MKTATHIDYKRRSGAFLIEMIVYIVLFALLMGLATTLFSTFWRRSRLLQGETDRIRAAIFAGELWRREVRASTSMPRMDGTIFRMRGTGGEFEYWSTNGLLLRSGVGDQASPVLPAVRRSEMIAEEHGGVRSFRWELELEPERQSSGSTPLRFTFVAVPRASP